MKLNIKKRWVIAGVFLLLLGTILFIRFFAGEEDSWIKDSRGVWIKHGNPVETPNYVSEQKTMILCAMDIYAQLSSNGLGFSSQCIGACGDYSIDIVNVPRTTEDDNPENQCEEYLNGETSQFIELDNHGEVVRISE